MSRGWVPLTLLLCGVLLIACQTAVPAPPTLIPLADTPVVASPDTPQPSQALQNAASVETAVVPTGTPPSPSTVVPTPNTAGIRPQEVQQRFVPNAGPEAAVAERPPPMQVPLSIHPDDHYWLIRPLPSRSRNYDLEWYPFGNDVLNPNLDPYRIHHGLDFPNETGTPILAASSGTVVHAGPFPSPRNGVNYYGNTVVIEHDWVWQGQAVYTLYAHTLELFVEAGDFVEQGQLIAGVGSSGEVSGPHLHFEVRVGQNVYGDARNPSLWIAPFEGMGTIAGRFVDSRGRFITTAPIKLRGVDVSLPTRSQFTYHPAVRPDDVFRENFVFADLPAGTYEVLLTGTDNIQYIREVEVRPGQTSFVVVSTNFEFDPTSTPPPTPTPEPEAETAVSP